MVVKTHIDKSWGYERIIETRENYKVKFLYINPGKSIHLQLHNKKDETMFCVSGQGIILCQQEVKDFAKGDSVRIRPSTIHKVWASMKEPLCIIEVSNNIDDSDVLHLEEF